GGAQPGEVRARADFQERSQEVSDIGQSFRAGSAVLGGGHPAGAQTGRQGDALHGSVVGKLCSDGPGWSPRNLIGCEASTFGGSHPRGLSAESGIFFGESRTRLTRKGWVDEAPGPLLTRGGVPSSSSSGIARRNSDPPRTRQVRHSAALRPGRVC